MTDEDARSLPAAAQAALRTRAVRAVLGGMTQAQAARVFGVHPNAVNRWIRRYREGGFPGLSARRRGRRAGSPRSFGPICVAGSVSQRWWPGSLDTRTPATPPNESPYLPAEV